MYTVLSEKDLENSVRSTEWHLIIEIFNLYIFPFTKILRGVIIEYT